MAIRKALGDDGVKLRDFWRLLAFEKDEKVQKVLGTTGRIRLLDRLEAARELADRGWGKPVQTMEVSGPDGGPIETQDLSAFTTQELRELREIYRRAQARQHPE